MRFACLALAVLSCAPCAAQVVTDSVDRFTGVRVIAYTAPAEKRPDLLKPSFTVKASVKDGKFVSLVSLLFASISNPRRGTSWRYLSCHQVNWLADGKPVVSREAKHNGDVVRGGVIEFVSQELPLASLKQIGDAQTVEYRVCRDVYTLSSQDIEAVGQVARTLESSGAKEVP